MRREFAIYVLGFIDLRVTFVLDLCRAAPFEILSRGLR